MNAISVLERFIIVMSVIKCLLYQVIILSNFLLMASWFFIFFLWLHNVSIEKLIWAEYWSHRNNVIMKCSDFSKICLILLFLVQLIRWFHFWSLCNRLIFSLWEKFQLRFFLIEAIDNIWNLRTSFASIMRQLTLKLFHNNKYQEYCMVGVRFKKWFTFVTWIWQFLFPENLHNYPFGIHSDNGMYPSHNAIYSTFQYCCDLNID